MLGQAEVLTASLGGLSKSAGLPQVKLGWIGFGGPSAAVDEAIASYEIVADTYLSASTPVQLAAPALIERGAAIREQIQARVASNLATLRRARPRRFHRWTCFRSRADGRRCCRFRRSFPKSRSCSTCLTSDGVLVHPGYFFDFSREAFVVVSLLVEPEVFTAAHRSPASACDARGPRVTRRESGLNVPLFSLASSRGWGIGEFPDLARFARWAAEAGQSVLQILPVGEMPPIERSPYSSMTAMALDPIYLSLADVPDFEGLGGEMAFGRVRSSGARRRAAVAAHSLPEVRRVEEPLAAPCVGSLRSGRAAARIARAQRFDDFARREAWWLEEYATFRALHAHFAEHRWQEWPDALRRADPEAVAHARAHLEMEIAYYKYLQWLAAEQWAEAKRRAWPTRIFGDLPFMISADSPDVWARQHEFRFDATIGVPPDAFSETGQDWGLPPWRWDVMAGTGFAWMAHAREALRLALRRLSHRSPRRPVSNLHPADRQIGRGVLRAGRRDDADRAWAKRWSSILRLDHRRMPTPPIADSRSSSPRISA